MVFDVLVIIVVLISAIIAFFRGLIREVLTIFGVAGSLVAAYLLGPLATPLVYNLLGIDETADEPQKLMDVVPYTLIGDMLTYGSIFIIVMIILSLFSHAVSESAKSLGLGAIDRTLGFIFGIARGAAIVALLYLPLHIFVDEETKKEWFEGSRTHLYIEYTAELFTDFIPEDQLPDEESESVNEEAEGDPLKEIKILDSLIDEGQDLKEKGEKAAEDLQNKTRELINGNKENTENTQGYDDDFRDTMDRLFEDATDTPQEETPATEQDNSTAEQPQESNGDPLAP